MADEIKFLCNVDITNGPLKWKFNPGQQTIDQTTTVTRTGGVIQVSTTAEAIGLGDVTSPGLSVFQNLDPANYVLLGTHSTAGFSAFARIDAGESYIIKLTSGSSYQAEADTSPIQMSYDIFGR